MSILFVDTETRSRTPISAGNDRYTRAAKCLIVTYALNDGPVKLWQPWMDPRLPADLRAAIDDPECLFVAHNAKFDRAIFRHALGISMLASRWHCTMAQAYAHGLPGSLETLGYVVGLSADQQKLVDDKYLIHMFCVPQGGEHGRFIEPGERPDDWAKFCNYAVRDTYALREIYRVLPKHNYQGVNKLWWDLDQRTNERGFQFDAEFARAAVDFLSEAKEDSDSAISAATGAEVTAATQRTRLLTYLQRKHGIDIESLRASEVREWLDHDDLDPEVRFLLEIRLEAGKSSGSKYKRGLVLQSHDERMRHTMQYSGAGRTGRQSHKGFQPGNMARPQLTTRSLKTGRLELVPVEAAYIDKIVMPGIVSKEALNNDLIYGGPNEAASMCLRHAIKAAIGNELLAGDWSNIESRVLAWIADEHWKLEAYRAVDRGEGVDLYKLLFNQFFGVPLDEINDTERQSGKVSELAFGFGGGVGALVTMAAGYQMDLAPLAALVLPRATPEQRQKAYKAWRRAFLTCEDYELDPKVYQACDILKQTYRASNAAIDQLKRDVDDAVRTAVQEPGRSFNVAKCTIFATESCLIIQLPSGRRLNYWNPELHHEEVRDPDTDKPIHRNYITYRTARGKGWKLEKAWAGLFVENIVQAIANDVLRWASLRVDRDTWTVPAVAAYLRTLPPEEQTACVLNVHDELVLELPKGLYSLRRMLSIMVQELSWAPGLPLAAEGWVNPVYGKRKGKSLQKLMKEAA